MITALARHAPLLVVLVRAIALYGFTRLLTKAAGGMMALMAGNTARDVPGFDNPIGIVILVTVLGALDLRRRQEQFLWRNLSYHLWQVCAIFAFVALLGELALSAFLP